MLSAMVLLASLAARAEVKLPRFFSDGMVLQQQSACNLWGTARAEKHLKVKTSWDGKTYTTTVGQDGKWQLQVNTPVAGGPYTITFDDGDKTQLQNILIGEVWICSGQSNMEMPMKGFKGQPVAGATEEIMTGADANLHFSR